MKSAQTAPDTLNSVAAASPAPERASSRRETASLTATANAPARVTWRALMLGLLLVIALSGYNAWLETVTKVRFIGGVHLPVGAVFTLGFLVLACNITLKRLSRTRLPLIPRPFTGAELLTVYAMMLFAALVSTPGTDSFFLTVGAGMFYFSTRENGWAETFYSHVPPHFAPGWDGTRYQREVIESLYLGNISPAQVPWHAWIPMLTGWSIFLLGCYSTLFFISLLLRRQWIENEALIFPLVELPLRMVDVNATDTRPPAAEFWGNKMLWIGVAVAFSLHMLRGLNNFFPDWPIMPAFQGNSFTLALTEQPWNALGSIKADFFLGAIGIAYLLTAELSGSMWKFFWLVQLQLVAATMLGYPAGSLPKDNYLGRPLFITYQSIGGWCMMAILLLWTARGHLTRTFREAWNAPKTGGLASEEPFSPRAVVIGALLSIVLLFAWCWFAGINILIAATFIAIYVMVSIVLARVVVEGGFLFPQVPFSPLDWMTGGLIGTAAMGAGDVTRMGFVQTIVFSDARTNTLPAWLHTLKIAHAQQFSPRDTRRLMLGAAAALVIALIVATGAMLVSIYNMGGLSTNSWFSVSGPQNTWKGVSSMIRAGATPQPLNWAWFIVGASVVWGLMMLRSRFMWFTLHPLAYIMASGYPIRQLWLSFFLGWLVKTLVSKYGSTEYVQRLRPFFLGLILGNALSMVLWMIAGFKLGGQIPYWPA